LLAHLLLVAVVVARRSARTGLPRGVKAIWRAGVTPRVGSVGKRL